MRNSLGVSMLVVATLVLSSAVFAQQRSASPAKAALGKVSDPFLGVWKLSADKSKYESGGAPRSFVRTYEDRGGGTIFMTTDVTIPQGSTRAYLVYRRDGTPLYFRYYDPRVLRVFLPTCTPAQLKHMFGPADAFLAENEPADSLSIFRLNGEELSSVQRKLV